MRNMSHRMPPRKAAIKHHIDLPPYSTPDATMMTYADIETAAGAHHLSILGGLHPGPEDGAPAGCTTLLLLGPGPGFWDHVTAAQEFADRAADPIDRWSRRVITGLAETSGSQAIFPFGGPPYAPFYSWALKSGRFWTSPVAFLVHDRDGLFTSFRGALALSARLDMPTSDGARPCDDCARPCLSACPVSALSATAYDVPRCTDYLLTPPGEGCLKRGCAARRACPVGQDARPERQSAYHMGIFLRNARKSAD